MAQNFEFNLMWQFSAKVDFKIELAIPNYIELATKNAFLALEIPKLEL